MTDYIALLRNDDDSDFGVEFPDFPGCVTAGRTLDEAKDMAKEALAFHVEGMIEDGAAIPAPSSLGAVMARRDNRDTVAFLVSVDTEADKAERINITLRRRLIARIDAVASNRSAFLAEAAAKRLDDMDAGTHRPPKRP